jgi:hypothetical protein
MSAKYTRPDQYYGKPGKAPRDIPDIRGLIIPAFAVLLVLEIVFSVAAFRFWRQQSLTTADQRTLFRANEIVAEARQDSLQLSRLVEQAIASPSNENTKIYATRVQKKSGPILDVPQTPDTIIHTLPDVIPSNLKLHNASVSFGETEWLRFERVADELLKLNEIDEKVLALLQGQNQSTGESFVTGRSDPEVVRGLLNEQSYQSRRTRLNEDFSAMQAALDLRILTLLNDDAANGRMFFGTALVALVLLLPATAFLAFFLHRHESRIHNFHKTQVRRLNDDLSRVRGELSQLQSNRGNPAQNIFGGDL